MRLGRHGPGHVSDTKVSEAGTVVTATAGRRSERADASTEAEAASINGGTVTAVVAAAAMVRRYHSGTDVALRGSRPTCTKACHRRTNVLLEVVWRSDMIGEVTVRWAH
jgi:hypothetical protein